MSVEQLKERGTYYELFDVSEPIDPKELRRAHARLIREYTNEHSPDEFMYIQEAYDTLKDPEKRAAYDASLSGGWTREPEYAPSSYAEQEEEQQWAQLSDEIDFISQLLEDGQAHEALHHAERLRWRFPEDGTIFHYYLLALRYVDAMEETDEYWYAIHSFLDETYPLGVTHAFILIHALEMSLGQNRGVNEWERILDRMDDIYLRSDEKEEVYEYFHDRELEGGLNDSVDYNYFSRAMRLIGRGDDQFEWKADDWQRYADRLDEEEVERRSQQLPVYEELHEPARYDEPAYGDRSYDVQPPPATSEYTIGGTIMFAIVLSIFFTPVIGILAGLYVHYKRIPIWDYIAGGIGCLVMIAVALVIFGFFFG